MSIILTNAKYTMIKYINKHTYYNQIWLYNDVIIVDYNHCNNY